MGLINFWMKDRKQAFKNINAGAETVRKLASFRAAFAEQRCVVPADGFFEWTGPKENRQPIWFHRSDGGLISFAGLYESWRPSPTEKERTFTIVTTATNALLEPIHNRMPVILEEDAINDWLYARQSPDSLMELLRPAREDLLVATPVSARVNSVKNDDPGCLEARESGDTTEGSYVSSDGSEGRTEGQLALCPEPPDCADDVEFECPHRLSPTLPFTSPSIQVSTCLH